MDKFVLCVSTLDTKYKVVASLKSVIESQGCRLKVMDVSAFAKAPFEADITAQDVLKASGSEASFNNLREMPQNMAMEIMKKGALKLILGFHKEEKLLGIISVGGGMGTEVACSVMRMLPIGLPKIIICSQKVLQAGLKRYIDGKDIIPFITVADMGSSVNFLLRETLTNAAYAMVGMVKAYSSKEMRFYPDNLVFLSVLGTVEQCANRVEDLIKSRGYEVVRFYAGGIGTMEEMIRYCGQRVKCVIELSLNEIGNLLFGGFSKALPDRIEEACTRGIPQIITCGNVNFLNFLEPETVPERFRNRPTVFHNPYATLPRLSEEELRKIAEVIVEKLRRSKGPVKFIIPKRGFSTLDREGAPLHDPKTDEAFRTHLKHLLKGKFPVVEVDANINDEKFVLEIVKAFDELIV